MTGPEKKIDPNEAIEKLRKLKAIAQELLDPLKKRAEVGQEGATWADRKTDGTITWVKVDWENMDEGQRAEWLKKKKKKAGKTPVQNTWAEGTQRFQDLKDEGGTDIKMAQRNLLSDFFKQVLNGYNDVPFKSFRKPSEESQYLVGLLGTALVTTTIDGLNAAITALEKMEKYFVEGAKFTDEKGELTKSGDRMRKAITPALASLQLTPALMVSTKNETNTLSPPSATSTSHTH